MEPTDLVMTRGEIAAFFDETPRCAVVGSLRRTGSPINTAVGFEWDGRCAYFSMLDTRMLIRRLQHDPRCCLYVMNTAYPVVWVSIEGTAEAVEDPNYENTLRIMRRYMSPAEASQEVKDIDLHKFERNYIALGRTLFRVTATKILSEASRKRERERHEAEGGGGLADRREGVVLNLHFPS